MLRVARTATYQVAQAALAAMGACSVNAFAQTQVQTPTLLAAMSFEAKAGAPNPAEAAFKSLNLDPNNWTQGQRDAVDFGQMLQGEREKLESVYVAQSEELKGRRIVGGFVDAGTVVAPFLGPWSAAGVAALKIVSDQRIAWKQAEFEAEVGKVKTVYDDRINDIAKLVIGRATANKPRENETPVAAAQRYAREFMDTPLFKSMDKAGQTAVRFQLTERVQNLLANGQQVGADELARLEGQRERLQTDVSNTQADLGKLEKQLKTKLDANERVLRASKAGLEALETQLKASTGKLQADVKQLQYMGWTQLPAKQRLELLNTPGFLPDMPGRDEVMEDLKVTVFAESTVQYATTVGNAAQLLNDLGLPLNMSSVNKGVNLVVSGVSAYASFATGDYFGGIASLGKLVGGLRGKPDAAAQQQMAIMQQLKQVMALQRETLKKLDALSNQLNVSTERILRSVTDVYEVSTLALRAGENLNWRDHLDGCRRFRDQANPKLSSDGLFVNYKARFDHFGASYAAGEFTACENLFRVTGSLVALRDDNRSHMPFALWGYAVDTGPANATKSPWEYQTLWYEPMLELTKTAMRAAADGPDCAKRALGLLASAPQSLHELYAVSRPCDQAALAPDANGRTPGLYISSINGIASFEGGLANVANPARAAEVARLMLFAQPFQELRQPRKQHSLYTTNQLQSASVSDALRLQQVRAYRNMADVLSVATAQQTVFSGVFSARWAAATLRAGNFGFASTASVERQSVWRQALAPLAPTGAATWWTYRVGQPAMSVPQEFGNNVTVSGNQQQALTAARTSYDDSYLKALAQRKNKTGYCPAKDELASNDATRQAAVIVCLMDVHPTLAQNVALMLFSDAVRQGGYDLALVDRWMREDSEFVLSGAMPGLTLVRTAPAGKPPVWGIRLLHPDGRELFLPAPAVAEMEQAKLSYPTPAYPLMQLRETLLDRAAALSSPQLLPEPSRGDTKSRLWRYTWALQHHQVAAPFESAELSIQRKAGVLQ